MFFSKVFCDHFEFFALLRRFSVISTNFSWHFIFYSFLWFFFHCSFSFMLNHSIFNLLFKFSCRNVIYRTNGISSVSMCVHAALELLFKRSAQKLIGISERHLSRFTFVCITIQQKTVFLWPKTCIFAKCTAPFKSPTKSHCAVSFDKNEMGTERKCTI